MQIVRFTYSASKQQKTAQLFLLLAFISIAVALYMWLLADLIILSVLVAAVLLAVLGLAVFLRLQFGPSKQSLIALCISDNGIEASTTPVAKAAGLILWADMEDVLLSPTVIDIKMKDPQKYADRMGNFFVRDSFLKSLNGWISIPYTQTDATYTELKLILETAPRTESI